MVHRSFVGKRVQSTPKVQQSSKSSYERSPNPAARSYAEEMAPVNGEVELTEEQMAEARHKREQFQNEVSKRMGDLLLRGWTMLDGYCQRCNGILMEKNDERKCIQCEVYQDAQRVEQPKQVFEVKLEEFMEKEEDDVIQIIERIKEPARPQSETSCTNTITKSSGIKAEPIYEPVYQIATQPSIQKSSTSIGINSYSGVNSALAALDRKLAWAATAMDQTNDIGEVRQLTAFIGEAVQCLKHFQA